MSMTYSEKYAKVHKMHLALQYENKRQLMHLMLNQYSVDIAMTYRYGGREVEYKSIYKNVPMAVYNDIKKYFDYTRFRVMFRGKRFSRNSYSTPKCNAKCVDVYEFSANQVIANRDNRETYLKGTI
jgi:hypothetical protein